MFKISWISFLFQALPETIASTAFCFALIKQPLRWSLILKIGLIYGIVAYFIRTLPISFGVHTIILVIVLTTLLVNFTRCKLTSGFMASMINMIIIASAEFTFGIILLPMLNLNIEKLYTNQWLWILFGIPQVFLLFGLAFFLNTLNNKNIFQ